MLKTLKEIRRLAALAPGNIIDAQECWSAGVAEIEDFDSIQAKIQQFSETLTRRWNWR